jgi:hypothetical protein
MYLVSYSFDQMILRSTFSVYNFNYNGIEIKNLIKFNVNEILFILIL